MRGIQNKQGGFTLIELVMVIVILGILAATALPKFVDLSSDAETAAVKGMAGGLASAASINYAGCAAVSNSTTGANAAKCKQVAKCSDVGSLVNPTLTLGTTASDTAYYLDTDAAAATNGTTVTCTLKKGTTTVYSSDFSAIGAGN